MKVLKSGIIDKSFREREMEIEESRGRGEEDGLFDEW